MSPEATAVNMQVLVLVGTGWSYMKPLLAKNEKAILVVVIPLQVFAEVAIIVLDESTPATRLELSCSTFCRSDDYSFKLNQQDIV